MKQISELFQDDDEQLVAVLGQAAENMTDDDPAAAKTFLALTNKRLYARGGLYRVRAGRQFGQFVRRSKFTMPVEDLGQTTLMTQNVFWFLVLGVIYVGISLYFGINSILDVNAAVDKSVALSIGLSLLVFFLGLGDILKYYKNKGIELFVLITRKGGLGINTALYEEKDINNFKLKLEFLLEGKDEQRKN